jgi:hypothetical protein
MLEAVSMKPNLPASGRADKLAPGTLVIGGLRPGSRDSADRRRDQKVILATMENRR